MKLYQRILMPAVFILAAACGATEAQQLTAFNITRLPRLSPRPQNVTGIAQNIISLNGTWQFTGGGKTNKAIQVPGEWEMQGFKLDSAATAVYIRHFYIPRDWAGHRIKLRFDAVSAHCVVKVNGKKAGEHEGSFVPFELDITGDAVSGDNTLEVDVRSQTISDILASTSQYAGHPVGGILRKVTLFVLPDVNMAGVTYTTTFDKAYRNAVLHIPVEIANEGKKPVKAEVIFSLKNADGETVAITGNKLSVGNLAPGDLKKDTARIQVADPDKWDNEHPYLYSLIIRLAVHGKVVETSRLKVGFREIEIRGDQLFVNDHPVKLHGVCRHSIAPYTGRSVSPAMCVKDAELFRDGNCNYIRTSHYPPEEEFLDACDSLGLFVESESSLCWIGHGAAPVWKKWNYKDPRFLPYLINANLEKMIADRNHPSVLCWSLGNESRWSPSWAKVNRIVKQLDPSRPTVFQDQSWGTYNNEGSECDIADYHYPGFNDPAAADSMTRPLQFDEYAHVENYNRREVVTDPYVRVAWGPSLARIYDSMYAHKGCLGGAIWAGIDDIFHMPDSSLIGYGPWGVIDGWRRKKPEYYAMKQAYAPVIIENAGNIVSRHGTSLLRVQNRYDFTNLSSLKITCKDGRRVQKVTADIPPHQTGTITIPSTEAGKNDSLYVIFKDPRGFICQKILISPEKKPSIANKEVSPSSLRLTTSPDTYLIKTKNTAYWVDRKSGVIKEAAIGNRVVVDSSPALMIVPLNRDDGGGAGITNCNYQKKLYPLMYKPSDNWQANDVHMIKEDNGDIRLTATGRSREATGTITTLFKQDGTVRISYLFTINDSIHINPRQWGLVFSLPHSYNCLSWSRKGYRSVYPANDIARNKGRARANPAPRPNSLTWARPANSWSSDANELGSNDFRSTKAHIYSATLSDKAGKGLQILSDGTQSTRACIEGNHILLLVADYNSGGSDRFSDFFYHEDRRPLKGGDKIKGTVHLKLVDQ